MSAAAAADTAWTTPQIESAATRELQKTVARQARLEGQAKDVAVNARLDATGNRLYVDLGAGYAPKQYSTAFEDRLNELSAVAMDAVEKNSRVKEVHFRIGGKELFDHYSDEQLSREKSRAQRESVPRAVRTPAGRAS